MKQECQEGLNLPKNLVFELEWNKLFCEELLLQLLLHFWGHGHYFHTLLPLTDNNTFGNLEWSVMVTFIQETEPWISEGSFFFFSSSFPTCSQVSLDPDTCVVYH